MPSSAPVPLRSRWCPQQDPQGQASGSRALHRRDEGRPLQPLDFSLLSLSNSKLYTTTCDNSSLAAASRSLWTRERAVIIKIALPLPTWIANATFALQQGASALLEFHYWLGIYQILQAFRDFLLASCKSGMDAGLRPVFDAQHEQFPLPRHYGTDVNELFSRSSGMCLLIGQCKVLTVGHRSTASTNAHLCVGNSVDSTDRDYDTQYDTHTYIPSFVLQGIY